MSSASWIEENFRIYPQSNLNLIQVASNPPGTARALSVLAITYIISLFTYSYIERPFFGKRQKSE